MEACDVDYRTAYLVVGRAVRNASRQGLRGMDITGELLDAAAREHTGAALGLAEMDLSKVLDPTLIVASRVAAGGAAPALVREMSAACAVRAAALNEQAISARGRFGSAERQLVELAKGVADAAVNP
jgi:argininosuccinate lyase